MLSLEQFISLAREYCRGAPAGEHGEGRRQVAHLLCRYLYDHHYDRWLAACNRFIARRRRYLLRYHGV